jgi:hypothetical protein
LDASIQLLRNVSTFSSRFWLLFKKELGNCGLFVGEDFGDGMCSRLESEIFEISVGYIESEDYHSAGKDAVRTTIANELVQVVADLLGDSLRLEKLLSRDFVTA